MLLHATHARRVVGCLACSRNSGSIAQFLPRAGISRRTGGMSTPTGFRLGVGVAETVRTTVLVIAEILLRNLRTVESVLRGCGLHLVLADPNHNAPLRIGFWIQIRQVFVTESYLTGGNAIYAPLQIRACIADICAAIPEFETTFIAMTRGAVLTIGAPPRMFQGTNPPLLPD